MDLDRLREHAELRLVAIPDTEGDVQAALGGLDEVLEVIAGWEEEEAEHGPTVGRLGTEAARDAVGRLAGAVRQAEAVDPAQPVAPDGRYELVPVAWATVRRADLVELGLAVQALGRAWGLGADELVGEALAEAARWGVRWSGAGWQAAPEDVVAEAARLHGLLSLPWDDDVSCLAVALPAGGGRVVLDEAAHAAYQRVVDRILGIWHAGDPLAPYLYRGQKPCTAVVEENRMTVEFEVLTLLASDGQPFIEARVPRIERRFRSSLHRAENVTVRMGSWRDELALVLGRRAPAAVLVADSSHLLVGDDEADNTAIRRAVRNAIDEGFAGAVSVNAEGLVDGWVALPDPIAATIDLAALKADYEGWFAAAGVIGTIPDSTWPGDTVGDLLGYAIDDLDAATYAEHASALAAGTLPTGVVNTAVVRGIVAGDDPASTCAFLLARLCPDGDYWHSLR